MDPYFTITKIYGIPHPAVDFRKGENFPNRLDYWSGFVFSLVGFPLFILINEKILTSNPFSISLQFFIYLVYCFSLMGFYKGSDWDWFRKFGKI